MHRFTFSRGIWEDGSALPEWADDEDFSNYLKRIGYAASKVSFGHEYGSQIEIYELDIKAGFYANVSPSGNACFEVFLPDFPSLMMFIRDHASAFATESVNTIQQEILSLLEKQFQAQHGHSANSICEECDPAGWAKNVRVNQERHKRREVEGKPAVDPIGLKG